VNWQAIGAIGELVGGVVVIASLVFLAIQIRRNTQALQLGAAAETNRSFAAYTAMFMQPGISRIYRIGLSAPCELDEDERVAFNAVISTLFNFLSYHHTLRGTGIAQSSEGGLNAAASYVLRQPGGEQWWARFRVSYDASFQSYVDSLISEPTAS
jgi:hypothetical protein